MLWHKNTKQGFVWCCQPLSKKVNSQREKRAVIQWMAEGCLRMLHVHVFLVVPLNACDMAQAGADEHQGGVAVGEGAHRRGALRIWLFRCSMTMFARLRASARI